MKKEIPRIPLIAGALLLLGLSFFLSPFPAGAVGAAPRQTTKTSGPVIAHEPHTFSFDCATGKLENLTTGAVLKEKNGGMNDLPLLFPGDVVKIIPVTVPDNGRYQGMKGFVFTDACPWGHASAKDFPCSDDGQKHVQVNKTAAYGVPNQTSGENLYIQEFEIVGNDIVKVQSWGGGDYTSTEDGSHVYGAANLEFVYLPSEAPVETVLQYSFNGRRDMTVDEAATAAYYTDEINTSVVFASDAIANSIANHQGQDMPVTLSVRRPYIEGFYFSGAAVETSTATYRSSDSANWHGNYWEGWIDNQVEFHPWLDNWAGKTVGYHAHYPETAHYKIQFQYKPGRTLTFDACGGTIGGYATRIYEVDNSRQYFDKDLQDGVVDEQFKKGKAYVPVRKGYVFLGWYEDAAYKTPVTSIKETVNKFSDNPYDAAETHVCRLYAKWEKEVKKGSSKMVDGSKYKITKLASGSAAGTVTLTLAKNQKSLTVPATVKIQGKTYKVTTAGAKAFTGSKIRTVTFSKNIKTIAAKAFQGSPAAKIVLKTKNLTKKSVKNSLKSSKITTIQVKVGTASQNKTYIKKYTQYFTKANAGKAVTVK